MNIEAADHTEKESTLIGEIDELTDKCVRQTASGEERERLQALIERRYALLRASFTPPELTGRGAEPASGYEASR